MAKRLGIPFLVSLTTYAPEEVTAAYRAISQALDRDCPETAGEEAESEASLARARDCLGGMPVVIDGEAVARPFAFARALLERGFHVRRMLVQKVIPSDRDSFDRVREQWPELELVQPQHHRSSCYRQDLLPDCLAIGYHSGYHCGAGRPEWALGLPWHPGDSAADVGGLPSGVGPEGTDYGRWTGGVTE